MEPNKVELPPLGTDHVGMASVVEPDGDEVEVRALLRIEADG